MRLIGSRPFFFRIRQVELGRSIVLAPQVIPAFPAPVLQILGRRLVERLEERELDAAGDDLDAGDRLDGFAGVADAIQARVARGI